MVRIASAVRRRLTRPAPRVLCQHPGEAEGTESSQRLNAILDRTRGSRYLEVGVATGKTLEAVSASVRVAVDPAPMCQVIESQLGVTIYSVTSDEYFARLPSDETFDLVFIDGLHEWKQTYRDVVNALMHGTSETMILIDDVVPDDALAALPNQRQSYRQRRRIGDYSKRWQGDVYKTLIALSLSEAAIAIRVLSRTPGGATQALCWSTERLTGGPLLDGRLAREVDRLTYDSVFTEEGTFRGIFDAYEINDVLNTVRPYSKGNES